MARIARIIAPGIPHHVTQRGNRRQRTFFDDGDYQAYLDFLFASAKAFQFEVWSYCLMPNHIHLLVIPESENSLRDGIAQVHQSYTRRVNWRQKWTGHLWQGRFYSSPIEPIQAALVARYIECNPIRAQLCRNPRDYKWSSADLTCRGLRPIGNGVSPFCFKLGTWEEFLQEGIEEQEFLQEIRKSATSGRPLGSEKFVDQLELDLSRILHAQSPGRKKYSGDGKVSEQ